VGGRGVDEIYAAQCLGEAIAIDALGVGVPVGGGGGGSHRLAEEGYPVSLGFFEFGAGQQRHILAPDTKTVE
jgi:hypothetical protein